MALSGTRLKSALSADYLTQLQSLFPIPAALLAAEKSAAASAQSALANALANAGGPDIVAEITGNAVVPVPGITTGLSTASGTVT
jgi:hypothetical protein